MKRLLIIGLLLVVALGSVACGSAQAATQNTSPASSVTIQDLQKQVNALQLKVSALESRMGSPSVRSGLLNAGLENRISTLEQYVKDQEFNQKYGIR